MGHEIKAKSTLKVINPEKVKTLLMPGEVGATIELIVKDKDGKITDHRGPMRSRSFVRQFLELLWIQARPATTPAKYDVRDITNTLRSCLWSGDAFNCDAAIAEVTKGVVVGTGNTAPTIDNYVMETLIAHGVAGGQLQYGAVTFGAPASDATTSRFTITRDFSNGSGGAITVFEIGLYVDGYDTATRNFLAIRDVVGGGLPIPNGQTLTVNYQPQAAI